VGRRPAPRDPPVRSPLRWAPLRWVVVHHLPIPRGLLRAPAGMFASAPGEFEADRATLVALIERAAARDAAASWGESPLLGRLTREEWGILSHRHFDHHLRRFGV
jgi:hypothetical protein